MLIIHKIIFNKGFINQISIALLLSLWALVYIFKYIFCWFWTLFKNLIFNNCPFVFALWSAKFIQTNRWIMRWTEIDIFFIKGKNRNHISMWIKIRTYIPACQSNILELKSQDWCHSFAKCTSSCARTYICVCVCI